MKRLTCRPNPGMAAYEQTYRLGNIGDVADFRRRAFLLWLNFGMPDFPAEVRSFRHNAERYDPEDEDGRDIPVRGASDDAEIPKSQPGHEPCDLYEDKSPQCRSFVRTDFRLRQIRPILDRRLGRISGEIGRNGYECCEE